MNIAFYPHMGLLSPSFVFYLISKSEYFGICTTWWINNNGLKVSSCTNLEIIGPKISSHESLGKCWVKFSMILFSHKS